MKIPLTLKDITPNTVIRGKNGGDGWYKILAADTYGVVVPLAASYAIKKYSWEELMHFGIRSEDGKRWKPCHKEKKTLTKKTKRQQSSQVK